MSKPARTIFYFGFYMILEVVLLLWSPDFLIKMAGIDPSAAVWLRLIGGIVAGLTIYYFSISLRRIRALYRVPIYERTAVFLTALALYLFNHAPLAVLLVGIVDLLGAIWTLWALKSEAKK